MSHLHITPAHPGEVLKDELEELGLTQTELADRIGVLPKTIYEICQGKRGLSASLSIKLSRALGASPQFWLNLQNNWEISQIDESEDFLESESKQGKRGDFERFLKKVPDVDPEEYDRLDS